VIIHFKAGRVAEAYAGMSFLGWIQMDIHYGGWSDEVTRIVREAKWQAPLFNHLPAEKEIILNLETRELSFQY